jgi:hypothetical protein
MVTSHSSKGLQAAFRLACELGAEFAGLLKHDVEHCVQRVRRANGLGPAWSVTEATDFGQHVLIRFDQAPELHDQRRFTVRVNKATGQITAKPQERQIW